MARRELRATLAERGIALLAAPVSGNAKVIKAGRLSFVCSGPRAAFDTALPFLRMIAPAASYVGEGELARIVKICHNVFLGVVTQSLAEITILAQKAGVPRHAFLAFMNDSVMGSTFSRYKTPAFVNLDFKVTFTPQLLRKDLDLGLDAARHYEVPMPLASLTRDLVQTLIGHGMTDEDFAQVAACCRRRHQALRSSRRTSPSPTASGDDWPWCRRASNGSHQKERHEARISCRRTACRRSARNGRCRCAGVAGEAGQDHRAVHRAAARPTSLRARSGRSCPKRGASRSIVENRPGAGGTIGAGIVANAPADGYTLLVHSAAYAVNPSMYPDLPFDTRKDIRRDRAARRAAERARRRTGDPVSSRCRIWSLQAKQKPGALQFRLGGCGQRHAHQRARNSGSRPASMPCTFRTRGRLRRSPTRWPAASRTSSRRSRRRCRR